jgi:hypothetical protein
MQTSTETRVGPLQLVDIGFPPDAEFRGETIRALTNLGAERTLIGGPIVI